MPALKHRRFPGAETPGVVARLHRRRPRRLLAARTVCWCNRHRSPELSSTREPRCRSSRTRSAIRRTAGRDRCGQPLYIAEDALDDIDVDLEILQAVVDIEKGLDAAAPHVHDDLGSNIAAHVRQTKGDYRSAAAKADLILKRRFRYEHGISSPIETRGVVAQWNAPRRPDDDLGHHQAPVFVRNGLAAMLGLGERQVRVIAPFVGGGFGPKIMMFYPEEVVLPWIAMRLNRPVK